jgi:hypothetical protein
MSSATFSLLKELFPYNFNQFRPNWVIKIEARISFPVLLPEGPLLRCNKSLDGLGKSVLFFNCAMQQTMLFMLRCIKTYATIRASAYIALIIF